MTSGATRWKRMSGVVQAEMAPGQTALLNLDTGQYHALNETGTRIWALLDQPCAFDQICAVLCSEYAIDAQRCADELSAYLQILLGARLIEPVA